MGLAIDASTPTAVTSTSGTATTASFAPPAGSYLVIAFAGNSTAGANPAAPTITDNLGVHLTYAPSNWRSRADGSPTVNGQAAIWTAPVVTGAPMTVSVACALAELAVKVWVITGQDTITPLGAVGEAGSASAAAVGQAYTAQATSGQGFGVICDWDALGAQTAGTGCTLDGTGSVGGSQISYAFVRRSVDDDTNGASNSLNSTLPGSSTNLQWVWVELLPAAVNQNLIDPPPFQVIRPPGLSAPNAWRRPWAGADDAPAQPITLAITATQGGVTANGMGLTVKMLTGAAASQPGTTNSTNVVTVPELAITPAGSGSWVYGALINANSSTAWTPDAASTFTQNQSDPTNSSTYGSYRSTATTTAATPVTLGATAPSTGTGGLAQAEIRNASGLTEVATLVATTSAATTVTTGAVTTIPGALLVAIVASDGGAGVTTMAVSGGGLTWTELVKANASAKGYAGVWIAQVPGGTPATAPAFAFAPARLRRPTQPRPRGARLAGPTPAQVILAAPGFVPQSAHARVKPAVARRRPAMVGPPLEQSGVMRTIRTRLKSLKLFRRQPAQVPPAQTSVIAPPYPPQTLWRRARALLGRRRPALASPATEAPGPTPATRLRARPPRPARPHATAPVPGQQVVTAPAYPPAAVRTRLRGVRPARGRASTPVPPQITVVPPAYVPQGLRARVRSLRLLRPRTAMPVPPQVSVAAATFVPGRVRQAMVRRAMVRRPRMAAAPVPVQATSPLFARLKTRLARLVRGRIRPVVPAQVIVIAPAYPPRPVSGRQKLLAVRRRRAGVDAWMVAGVVDCALPRPDAGVTPRPVTTTTARPGGSILRPGSGVTLRPASGDTDNPC